MDRMEARVQAMKLLDTHFGLGKDQVQELVRTSAEVNAVYQCSLNLLVDLLIAAQPFVKAVDDIEREYGSDLPDHQIQFSNIAMGEYRRIRNTVTVKQEDLSPPTPQNLLVTLSTAPTWLKPHQYDAAHELKKKGWVIIGLASGDNPPRHARLTLAGIHEKQRCLNVN